MRPQGLEKRHNPARRRRRFSRQTGAGFNLSSKNAGCDQLGRQLRQGGGRHPVNGDYQPYKVARRQRRARAQNRAQRVQGARLQGGDEDNCIMSNHASGQYSVPMFGCFTHAASHQPKVDLVQIQVGGMKCLES